MTVQTGESPSVILIKGAEIHSSDQEFNDQILDKKIVIKESKISYKHKAGFKQLIVSNAQPDNSPDKNSAARLKNAGKKKEHDELQRIQKELAKYEARKDYFQNEKIHIPFSSAHFSSVQSNNKNYIGSSSFHFKSDKSSGKSYRLITQSTLRFLHTDQYKYYNTQAIKQCYTVMFLVRPPPFFM